MPIGPPSQVPLPKSALRRAVVPTLVTQVDDWGWTGSDDTSACQKESAGVVGQAGAPGIGLAWVGWTPAATAARAATASVAPDRRRSRVRINASSSCGAVSLNERY